MNSDEFRLKTFEKLMQEFKRTGGKMTWALYLSRRSVPKGFTFEDAFLMYVNCIKKEGTKITETFSNGNKLDL